MKLPSTIKNKGIGGFTIIEVVLVLAIAGLIFLLVFLALPQLQQSRRDTQRRADAGAIVSALESYAANNNGNYPHGEVPTFQTTYVDDLVTPDQTSYTLTESNAKNPGTNEVFIAFGDTAGGDDCSNVGLGGREVAIRMGLEEGVYCQDNK